MKVEVDITKGEADALRRFLGLHTKTSTVACIKSLLHLILKNPHELEVLMYEKGNS